MLRGDRHQLGSQVEVLRGERPDVVVDMICYTRADAADLCEVFAGHAGRAVVLSSCDVYRQFGGLIGVEDRAPDGQPLTESSPLRLKHYPFRLQAKHGADFNYSYEKLDVEEVLGKGSLPACVLRLPVVYGEGDKQRRFSTYLKRLRSGAKEILVSELHAGQRITRGYVENMAHAISLAVTNGASAGRTYNVADEVTVTEAEFVRAIVGALGLDAAVRVVPADQVPADQRYPGDARYDLVIDSGAIRRELGHRDVVGFGEGVGRTARWEWESLGG